MWGPIDPRGTIQVEMAGLLPNTQSEDKNIFEDDQLRKR